MQLRRLFYGHRPAAVAFQSGLLAVDLAAIAHFLATTFVADAPWLRAVDLLLGILLALEFLGRMFAHRHPMQYLDNGAAMIDLVVIASLFVSALGANLGFLRVLRTVRLFRSYYVLGRLKRQSPVVRRNEEVILAALNLAVFVLMVSSLVFVAGPSPANPMSANAFAMNGNERRDRRRMKGAPSRSWMLAGWGSRMRPRPSVSTMTCRLRPFTFFPAS